MQGEPTVPATTQAQQAQQAQQGQERRERRRRELRGYIHALTGGVIDHEAAGRYASARADKALIAELRRELAELSGGSLGTVPDSGGGKTGRILG